MDTGIPEKGRRCRLRCRDRHGYRGRGAAFGVNPSPKYIVLSLSLPLLWMISIRVVGGYEMRFLGTGSDEFRKVLNAGVA